MIVVALTAIGILMVYSSSAMKAYIATDDTLTIVGPQIGWAGARAGRDGRDDAGRLPLPAVRVGAVRTRVALVLLVLVFVPSLNVVVGGSARWLKIGAAAGPPPGRGREARA